MAGEADMKAGDRIGSYQVYELSDEDVASLRKACGPHLPIRVRVSPGLAGPSGCVRERLDSIWDEIAKRMDFLPSTVWAVDDYFRTSKLFRAMPRQPEGSLV